jgi:2-methylisocitrate lyase-like PEP mutase family enzyme
MATVGKRITKPLLANVLEDGTTPWLPPERLEALGFKIAAYPLTLLSAATVAMESALGEIKAGRKPAAIKSFRDLRAIVGFDDYDAEAARYVRRES